MLQLHVLPVPNTMSFYVLPTQKLTIPVTPQGGFNPSPLVCAAVSFNPG
jgi:hypothetical protein